MAATTLLLACGPRQPVTFPPAPVIAAPALEAAPTVPVKVSHPDYIDLQPGWRLTVVTPLLKSGGYLLRPADQQVEGNTITLSAGEDLLGYETALYAVEPRDQGGVRLEFLSAEATKVDENPPESLPHGWRITLPIDVRFVRLIYLKRLSRADHNMAIVAASDREKLATLTREFQANPSGACKPDDRGFCGWVPAGVAVRPEVAPGRDSC